MEFFLGSITALACTYVISRLSSKLASEQSRRIPVLSSQSYRVDMLSRAGIYQVSLSKDDKVLKTQATDFHDNNETRVVLHDSDAYWIENSQLMSATFDGRQIVQDTKKKVDTMSLNSVELVKISVIVQKLTERFNDEGSDSGDQRF